MHLLTSFLIEARFRSRLELERNTGGGAEGGGPPYGFCDGFRFGVMAPKWFRVGRDHVSLRLIEGVVLNSPVGGGCSGALMVRILLRV